MMTQEMAYDLAMRTSLRLMATPHAAQMVSKLEQLILDVYEQGLRDGGLSQIEAQVQMDLRELQHG
jgi:hypothetical protein